MKDPGLSAGRVVAEQVSSSPTALEGNLAPQRALRSPVCQGDRGTKRADTPGGGRQRSQSVDDRQPRGSHEDVPCSQLPFHDFSNESEKRSFRKGTDCLAAGQILVTRLYGPDGSFDSEAAFRILAVRDFRQGPVLAVDFLGASRALRDIEVSTP